MALQQSGPTDVSHRGVHGNAVQNGSMNASVCPLIAAVLLSLSAGCATGGGARPQPFPRPSSPEPAPSTPTPTERNAVATTALGLTGIKYLEGGGSPEGFDCSGFTRYVFAQHGIPLPRRAEQQYLIGRRVEANELRAGDLVFFTTVAPGASHVGLMIDTRAFVHAPSERGVVRVEQLSSSYWARRYLGARRVTE